MPFNIRTGVRHTIYRLLY